MCGVHGGELLDFCRNRRGQREEDDIRQAIEDVRAAKKINPDGWREDMRLRKGIDYWELGEDGNLVGDPTDEDDPGAAPAS